MRLTKLLVNLFLSTVLLTNPLIAQHSPKQTNSDQGATSLKPKALDQVCCSNAQLVVQRALPNLRTIRPTLEPGELAIIDYRLGRALLPAEKELGIEYLRSALASASIAPERNVPMEADSAPSSEAKRLQLFYNEQLRRQETVQNAVLAEMTKVDFAAAVEQIAKLTPSRKGYQKLKFGDTVLAFPPERNTNTHLICIVSQSLSSTDPNGAANFFSEHSYRLNEPVFLPAFHLYDKLSEKNEIAADQVKGAIKERVIHLLEHGDRGTVIVTHFTLSRSLAEAHSASLVKEIAELSLAHIGENFGNDFSIPLQRELARAFHQYSATLYRWGKDTQLAVEFQHHRNRMLQKIGISPDEFEKSELTIEGSRDPRKFALAMSYQSQQFASQILAQTEFSNLSKVTVEELEGNFQTSSGYRKFTLALKLNEKLFPTDPVKAEKYLLMARMLALEESDVFQRTMMQSVVYAQGINRCSKEILTRLATDPVETASILIRKHDTNQKQEAAFISTLLTPFIMEYSEVDLLGAVKVISQIPDSWIQADLTTAAIESSLARKSGIPVQK